MRTVVCLLSVSVSAVALAGCGGQPEPPPFKVVANADQIMDGILTPAAEVFWGSVSTIITKEGIQENFPRTDEEWETVWGAAMTIAESGNLLMMRPSPVDSADWMRFSSLLVDRGVEAVRAAEAKDPDRILETGERVYNVCVQCHEKYLPE
jgi:hypothetical protein